jgi:hypothetical protein
MQVFEIEAYFIGCLKSDRGAVLYISDEAKPTDSSKKMVGYAVSPECEGACQSKHVNEFRTVYEQIVGCSPGHYRRFSEPLRVVVKGVGFIPMQHSLRRGGPTITVGLGPLLSIKFIKPEVIKPKSVTRKRKS